MRMTNDRDQALVRSGVADTATNLLAFLPSLGTREVFAFGEGVAPTRLKFKQLSAQLLPKSEVVGAAAEDFVAGINPDFTGSVLERWRGATTNQSQPGRRCHRSPTALEAEAAPLQPAPAPDPNRFRTLLRRPLSEVTARRKSKRRQDRRAAGPTAKARHSRLSTPPRDEWTPRVSARSRGCESARTPGATRLVVLKSSRKNGLAK